MLRFLGVRHLAVIEHLEVEFAPGLNILQTGPGGPEARAPRVFVSDFLDFSIYIDASERNLEDWYIQRFQRLRHGAAPL